MPGQGKDIPVNHEPKKTEEMQFEEAFEELEAIVAQFEKGELKLEESLTLFERGTRLAHFCAERLDTAEKRIGELVRGALAPAGEGDGEGEPGQ
ncbi:exodeoxyribonuclease VII small subunit [bacterium]|nr:exodeoxyribonuclease VII small subunit [candidate division CSSED10-310 bacterium]